MILAGTGHRPNKLGGYGYLQHKKLINLAKGFLSTFDGEIDAVISGMALGWDQALAEAALELGGIPLWCYLPCLEMWKPWPKASQEKCQRILDKACKIEVAHEGPYPGPWCMQKRNCMMVTHANELIALWDGTPGGTANCIEYAESVHCKVNNLWDVWNERHTQTSI